MVIHAVDDIMGHFGVLGHGQHEAPRDADGVPHQEHAVPLPLQQGDGFSALDPAPVPTIAVFGIKVSGHVCDLLPEAGGLLRSATHTKLWLTDRCGRRSKSRPTGATSATRGRLPSLRQSPRRTRQVGNGRAQIKISTTSEKERFKKCGLKWRI